MNKQLNKENNKRFTKATIICFCIVVICVLMIFLPKESSVTKSIFNYVGFFVGGITLIIWIIWIYSWTTTKKTIKENPNVSSIKEIDTITESNTSKKMQPLMDKLEKVSETKGKIEAMKDKYKYAEIAKTVKESLEDEEK